MLYNCACYFLLQHSPLGKAASEASLSVLKSQSHQQLCRAGGKPTLTTVIWIDVVFKEIYRNLIFIACTHQPTNKRTNQLHYKCLIFGNFPLERTSSELTSTTRLTSSWLAVSMASSLIFFNCDSFADTQEENSENLKAHKHFMMKGAHSQEGAIHFMFWIHGRGASDSQIDGTFWKI